MNSITRIDEVSKLSIIIMMDVRVTALERHLALFFICLENLLHGALIAGWPSLVFIFNQLGYFSELCNEPGENITSFIFPKNTGDTRDHGNLTRADGLSSCPEQDSRLQLVFSVAVAFQATSMFPVGFLFNRLGTKNSRLVMSFLLVVGYLFVAFSSPSHPLLLFPGTVCFIIGSVIMLFSSIQVGNLFGGKKSTVIAIINAMYSAAAIVPVIAKRAHEAGVSINTFFFIMSGAAVLPVINTFMLLPSDFIPWPLPEEGYRLITCYNPRTNRSDVEDHSEYENHGYAENRDGGWDSSGRNLGENCHPTQNDMDMVRSDEEREESTRKGIGDGERPEQDDRNTADKNVGANVTFRQNESYHVGGSESSDDHLRNDPVGNVERAVSLGDQVRKNEAECTDLYNDNQPSYSGILDTNVDADDHLRRNVLDSDTADGHLMQNRLMSVSKGHVDSENLQCQSRYGTIHKYVDNIHSGQNGIQKEDRIGESDGQRNNTMDRDVELENYQGQKVEDYFHKAFDDDIDLQLRRVEMSSIHQNDDVQYPQRQTGTADLNRSGDADDQVKPDGVEGTSLHIRVPGHPGQNVMDFADERPKLEVDPTRRMSTIFDVEERKNREFGSLCSCFLSVPFVLLLIWQAFLEIDMIFTIGTLTFFLTRLSNGDEDLVNWYTDAFSICLFFVIVVGPLGGLLMDRNKISCLSNDHPNFRGLYSDMFDSCLPLTITTLSSIGYTICLLLPSLPLQYLSFILILIVMSLLYGVGSAAVTVVFPMQYFTSVYGAIRTISGFFAFLQYPIFILIQKYLDNDPFVVFLAFIVADTTTLVLPAALYVRSKKRSSKV